jgi:ABC-2 type transport system ATP-binding protein
LKLIAGLNRPEVGQVLIKGRAPRFTKAEVAYLPEIDYLNSWMTIKQAAAFIRSFYQDWDQAKYAELLKFLNLDEEMKIARISKGQRAKAKLLLAVSRQASYLLMDEPLSGIDLLTRDQIIGAIINDYRAGEQTIIISTHEIAEVENLVDEVIFLDQGNIKLAGPADELREQKGKSLVEIMKVAFRDADQG